MRSVLSIFQNITFGRLYSYVLFKKHKVDISNVVMSEMFSLTYIFFIIAFCFQSLLWSLHKRYFFLSTNFGLLLMGANNLSALLYKEEQTLLFCRVYSALNGFGIGLCFYSLTFDGKTKTNSENLMICLSLFTYSFTLIFAEDELLKTVGLYTSLAIFGGIYFGATFVFNTMFFCTEEKEEDYKKEEEDYKKEDEEESIPVAEMVTEEEDESSEGFLTLTWTFFVYTFLIYDYVISHGKKESVAWFGSFQAISSTMFFAAKELGQKYERRNKFAFNNSLLAVTGAYGIVYANTGESEVLYVIFLCLSGLTHGLSFSMLLTDWTTELRTPKDHVVRTMISCVVCLVFLMNFIPSSAYVKTMIVSIFSLVISQLNLIKIM